MASGTSPFARGTIGLVVLALALAGCSDSGRPLVTQPGEPNPLPSSPTMAVRSLEWCWDHRDAGAYAELLTEDFSFRCADPDSAGNAFLGRQFTRLDELESVRRLFLGGGSNPPAKFISLQLDQELIPEPDGRPGKGSTTFHRVIVSSVVLRIDTRELDFLVAGAVRFFLVRGDSALIPAELIARGHRPDSTRWYIERWEDETVGLGAAAARAQAGDAGLPRTMPPSNTTWCSVKAIYR